MKKLKKIIPVLCAIISICIFSSCGQNSKTEYPWNLNHEYCFYIDDASGRSGKLQCNFPSEIIESGYFCVCDMDTEDTIKLYETPIKQYKYIVADGEPCVYLLTADNHIIRWHDGVSKDLYSGKNNIDGMALRNGEFLYRDSCWSMQSRRCDGLLFFDENTLIQFDVESDEVLNKIEVSNASSGKLFVNDTGNKDYIAWGVYQNANDGIDVNLLNLKTGENAYFSYWENASDFLDDLENEDVSSDNQKVNPDSFEIVSKEYYPWKLNHKYNIFLDDESGGEWKIIGDSYFPVNRKNSSGYLHVWDANLQKNIKLFDVSISQYEIVMVDTNPCVYIQTTDNRIIKWFDGVASDMYVGSQHVCGFHLRNNKSEESYIVFFDGDTMTFMDVKSGDITNKIPGFVINEFDGELQLVPLEDGDCFAWGAVTKDFYEGYVYKLSTGENIPMETWDMALDYCMYANGN